MSNQRIPSIHPDTSTGRNKKHFEMFTLLAGIEVVQLIAQKWIFVNGPH